MPNCSLPCAEITCAETSFSNTFLPFRISSACGGMLLGILVTISGVSQAGERWTSLTGSRTVEADFVGLWGEQLVLQLPDSRRVAVDVNNLVAESRILARKLAAQQDDQRTRMVGQIRADAKEAAAPAPTPLPKPDQPPNYRPFSGGGVMETLDWFDSQKRNGHMLLAAFDVLPPSYQGEIERVVRATVAKMNMPIANQTVGSVHSIGDLIVTRQRWLFSYPRFKALPEQYGAPMEGVLLNLAGAIREGLDPNEFKLEEIPNQSLRNWIAQVDERMSPYMAAMLEQVESAGVQPMSFNVTEEKDGKAIVEVTTGTQTTNWNLVSVEGMWVPEDMNQEAFAEKIKLWDEWLAETPDGSLLADGQATMMQAGIATILLPLTQATTSRDMHAQMDAMVAQVSPMASAAMQSMNLGGGRRRSMGGYGGYDEDYMMDMDMEMEMEGMDAYEQEMMQGMQGDDAQN